MEYLSQKVAYLKGLAEGLKIEDTDQGKLLTSMIDVLGDIAEEIADVQEAQIQLSENIDSIDEDLAQLESEVYGDEQEDYEEQDDSDMEYFEVECPNCHETVYLDENMLDSGDDITCPNCKETIEIEFDCDCGCGDCKDKE